MSEPTVAIVHDYLTQRGGAERVVLSMHRAFPDAPIHTSLFDPAGTFAEFAGLDVRVSPLDRVAPLRRHHRAALALFAPTFSRWTIDADVVLCSSSAWAHGVRTHGTKVVYCYTPARWLWLDADVTTGAASVAGRLAMATLGPALRRWDRRAAHTAARYLTSSQVVAARIRHAYGIDAEVLPPPVTIDADGEQRPVPGVAPGFWLSVARLLPYKHVDAVVRAVVERSDDHVVVVGDGPSRDAVAECGALAPDRVHLLRGVDEAQLRWLYAHCTALVSAAHEDFGLTPLEAAAFGRPAVVRRGGGFDETVVEGRTGVFFDDPDPSAIATALDHARHRSWSQAELRTHAATFGEDRFVDALRLTVTAAHREAHPPRPRP